MPNAHRKTAGRSATNVSLDRAAKVIPWTPRDLRSHTALYPYMAEWLNG